MSSVLPGLSYEATYRDNPSNENVSTEVSCHSRHVICEKFLPAPKLYQSININTCLFCNVSSYKCCFSDVLFAQIKHWNDKVKMWICITTEQIAKPNMYCILFKIIGYLSCHHQSYATGDCAVTQLQCTIMHINMEVPFL